MREEKSQIDIFYKFETLHEFVYHPYTGAMLVFSVPFLF